MIETLYDTNGTPVAYLDKDDGNTFFFMEWCARSLSG